MSSAATPLPVPSDGKKLTAVQEDYLALIYTEALEHGAARGCSIAKSMGVTRGTVAVMLRALKAAGFVQYEPYGPLHLTQEGRRAGAAVCERRRILQDFFQNVMKLEAATAARLSHELEHAVNADSLRRFDRFNTFFAAHADLLNF